jgi:hypothetical protein
LFWSVLLALLSTAWLLLLRVTAVLGGRPPHTPVQTIFFISNGTAVEVLTFSIFVLVYNVVGIDFVPAQVGPTPARRLPFRLLRLAIVVEFPLDLAWLSIPVANYVQGACSLPQECFVQFLISPAFGVGAMFLIFYFDIVEWIGKRVVIPRSPRPPS